MGDLSAVSLAFLRILSTIVRADPMHASPLSALVEVVRVIAKFNETAEAGTFWLIDPKSLMSPPIAFGTRGAFPDKLSV